MIVSDDGGASRAVVAAELDVVETRVGEVETPRRQIERQAVRPVNLAGDDDAPVAAVHPGALDARVLPPVAPEQAPHATVKHTHTQCTSVCTRAAVGWGREHERA